MELEILYRDHYLVAINKPNGLLVHRTKIATETEHFALQTLRDQMNQKVYPVHRIDRKTSGVLIFALEPGISKNMQDLLMNRSVKKEYLAIVRGYTDDSGEINYPLRKESGQIQDAITRYNLIAKTELIVPYGGHPTSRYSFIQVFPETGRMHQIRRHLKHIKHPIIGDRPYGCNKQNKLFKEKWDMHTMMLHAWSYQFIHPVFKTEIAIKAPLPPEFKRVMTILNWDIHLIKP